MNKLDKVQEKYYEMQMINSHIEQLDNNLMQILEQIEEVNTILNALDDIKEVKKENDILVPIANGIFAKAKLSENSKFVVNVGQNTLVEKNVEETKELISKQLIELEQYKELIEKELEKLTEKAYQIEKDADDMVKKNV